MAYVNDFCNPIRPTPDDDEIPIVDANRFPEPRPITWTAAMVGKYRKAVLDDAAKNTPQPAGEAHDGVVYAVPTFQVRPMSEATPVEREMKRRLDAAKPVVERKPVVDPATEAFYRDRREAAKRCMCGVPNPKDEDDQRAMSRKIDLVEHREYQLRFMADLERDAGYSWFEDDDYKKLTGYTERKRNGKV